jgi:hypothetical protein
VLSCEWLGETQQFNVVKIVKRRGNKSKKSEKNGLLWTLMDDMDKEPAPIMWVEPVHQCPFKSIGVHRKTEVFRHVTNATCSYIAKQQKHATMPLHLVLIAVIVLAAIIAVALLRPAVRWLAGEWHAAKCRNYPNRLQ